MGNTYGMGSKNTRLAYDGVDLALGRIGLKARGIWRQRQDGFSSKRPGRRRQEEADLVELEADIRRYGAPLAAPLLGIEEAHRDLRERVPDLVDKLVN